MMHVFIDIAFIAFIFALLIIVFIKNEACKKHSDMLIDFLIKNINFLSELNRKQEISQLKKTILLYTNFQVVLKMCDCDYISFFKYDYSNKYIHLHFILTIDRNGTMIHDSLLYDMTLSGSLLTLDILNTSHNDIKSFNIETVKVVSNNLYHIMMTRDIKKIYYKNVYRSDSDIPVGFISFSYKDPNFILDDDIKPEILRIVDKIKNYI